MRSIPEKTENEGHFNEFNFIGNVNRAVTIFRGKYKIKDCKNVYRQYLQERETRPTVMPQVEMTVNKRESRPHSVRKASR